MKKLDEFLKSAKPGTDIGKIFYMSLFFLLAILIMVIGFWKTLFVAAMVLVGYFIGSTADMKKTLKEGGEKMNKFKNKVVVYTKEDLNKVIKPKQEVKETVVEESETESGDKKDE